jgi:Response regulator containing a CheY-like receiver domain and an HD-GYP domain
MPSIVSPTPKIRPTLGWLVPRTKRSIISSCVLAQCMLLSLAAFSITRAWPHMDSFGVWHWAALGGEMVILLAGVALATVLVGRHADWRLRTALRMMNDRLEDEMRARYADVLETRNALIFGLAKLADCRDTDTGAHLERIGEYATVLARRLQHKHHEIDERWIARLRLASSLHDIGKVGIPDAVLLKPGRLTSEERVLLEQHPIIGADTLLAIRQRIGPDEFIDMAVQIALQHHEKWDGSGYPYGLQTHQISLAARIVALADFYDAVTSKRVYKPAMSHAEASKLVVELRGSHFDPEVADAFLEDHSAFDHIRKQHQDEPTAIPIREEFAARAATARKAA